MASKVDLYGVLGVSRDASAEQIKRAYRTLARQHHPDVSTDPGADERFKEINLAYEVLSDPDKRQQYDAFGTTNGRSAEGMGGFSSINDIFEMFFGGGGFGGFGGAAQTQRRNYHRGEDIHKALHLKLAQCLQDQEIAVQIERREPCEACKGGRAQPGSATPACTTCGGAGVVNRVQNMLLGYMTTSTTCPACHGEGVQISDPCHTCSGKGYQTKTRSVTLTIPAGVDESVNSIRGVGHAGTGGAPAGDLIVTISVEPDTRFIREGTELYTEVPVHYADLALGATVTVPTLTGEEQLRIPAGTSSHHVFQLRGHGMPRLRGNGRGALHARVVLAVPKRISGRQRELLEALRAEDAGTEQKNGLFSKRKR